MEPKKSDSSPTSGREAKPEPAPASRPTAEPASRSASKPEPKSEPKSESSRTSEPAAKSASKTKAKPGTAPEVNPASPTDEEVRAATLQDDENMGPRTGTSPITQVDYRDGVDPISGARQGEKQRP